MKIRIDHISNTFNYGSCMMAISIIRKLNDNKKDIKFYVDTKTTEDLKRLKQELGLDNIYPMYKGDKVDILSRAINKIRRISINRSISSLIIIGGDDISEYYGIEALEKELKRLEELSQSKNVILVGQTIGPFTDNRGELSRKCLEKVKIYTRDDKSLEYLENLNFKNVQMGRDLAFLELPNKKANTILEKYNINDVKYLTMVPSGLYRCYTQDKEEYIKEYLKILEGILENKRLKEHKVVLLPHVLLPEHVDDRLIIRELLKLLDKKYQDRIVGINDDMLPSEARAILGNGLFTITGRMHAAVSTFFMKKPAISLSYSVKYSGVIGEGLDMNSLVVEATDKELWKQGKISKEVLEKVDYVLDKYDFLLDKIDKKVNITTKIVEDELDKLAKEL